MSDFDKQDQIQLKQAFNEASELLENTSIISANKRYCREILDDVQKGLAEGSDSQEINKIIMLLAFSKTILKHGIEQENIAGSDPLTGVANRRSYEQIGERTISKLNRGDIESAAILYVDIKNFRDFNNNYGHDVGDQALIEITKNIQQATRDTDVVSRIGGDEFTIIATHKDKGHEFDTIRDHIYQQFEDAHIVHEGEKIPLVVTVGIADLTKNDNLHDAAKRADKDMYNQKQIQKREMGENIYASAEPSNDEASPD